MSHSHHHHHHHQHHAHKHGHASKRSQRRLLFAFVVNIAFAALEFVGGLWTNSVAIQSNALHDLGDAFSLGLSWYLERVAEQKTDAIYTYGYRRFSLLGAVLNSLFLIVGSMLILLQAVPRIVHPQPVALEGMLIVALVGLAINALAAWRLRAGTTMNERVVSWHLIEDALGWLAVVVVSLTMRFWEIPLLDPLLSILITVFVLYNVVGRLRDTVRVFLQAVPEAIPIEQIEKQILTIDGVVSAHHTRLWSLDGRSHILTTHVVLAESLSHQHASSVKRAIKQRLLEFDIDDATIEIELESELCANPQT